MPSNARPGASSHSQVQELNASAGGLVKATLGAATVAGAVLTFLWLPAEYGIDPTGAGRILGLTEMGQIKQQLHEEADADAALALAAVPSASEGTNLDQRLHAIEAQLAGIAAAVGAQPLPTGNPVVEPSAENTAATNLPLPASSWIDELEYTLSPAEGIEIKLIMDERAVAEFEWSANGAVLNYDTHGDGNGQSISYEKGRAVPAQAGQLTAAFTGNHGWFWRNRTDEDVVLSLRLRGNYNGLVVP